MGGSSIAFVIEKGGTGKSTVTFNVGWALSEGKRVLLIDLDGQKANLTYFCGIDKEGIKTIKDILDGTSSLEDSVVSIKDGLDILPGDDSLIRIGSPQHFKAVSKQRRFKEFVEEFEDANEDFDLDKGNLYQLYLIEEMQRIINNACRDYDFVLLDPNPSPNYLHTLALCSARYIIIPVLPDAASIESDEGTAESLNLIREEGLNDKVEVLGILFNRYTERTNLSKQVRELIEEFAEEMGTSVFASTIRNSVVLSECVGMHIGITDYRPNSPAAADVKAVAAEIQRRIDHDSVR